MRIGRSLVASAALGLACVPVAQLAAQAQDNIDNQIVDEGLNRSQVPEIAHELIDGIGPRLTNSTNMRLAEDWAVKKMRELGLVNVHKEGFEFGRGWDLISSDVRTVSPKPMILSAIPIAWTPPTNGAVQAEIVVAPISKEEHFGAYRGKLAGKIVFVSVPGTGDEPVEPLFKRLDANDIRARDAFDLPNFDPAAADFRKRRIEFPLKLDAFLKSEGAVAWARISRRDGKLLHGEGYNFEVGASPQLPAIELAAEDYRKLARMAKLGSAPVLSIISNVRYVDGDTKAYNVIGEIVGSDSRAGYVMAGAHLDSWVAADGAVDNGAGSVAVIEAARILKALGVRPKRTVRFVLWSGEEQGVLGSLGYVRDHLASRSGDEGLTTPRQLSGWKYLYPIKPKPGYFDLKAYFNMDNGSGKIRGIHAENNSAAVPMLRKWLAPYAGLDASSVVAGTTGGTDHVYMQAIGVPGFQFIQDPLDYGARLHHSSMDTFDHLRLDDLRQASVVMAGVLLAAANDPETLPREPVPQQPNVTDPFTYKLPDED